MVTLPAQTGPHALPGQRPGFSIPCCSYSSRFVPSGRKFMKIQMPVKRIKSHPGRPAGQGVGSPTAEPVLLGDVPHALEREQI